MRLLGLAGRIAAKPRALKVVQVVHLLPTRRYATTNFPTGRELDNAAALTVNLNLARGGLPELQQAAINRVEEYWALGPRPGYPNPHRHNSVVVLVSRSLAAWLDDDDFMSRIVSATGMSRTNLSEVTVLAAAVDEVPRYDRRLDFFGSSEGISLLRGKVHHILPHLYHRQVAEDGEVTYVLQPDVQDTTPVAPLTPQLKFQPPPTRHVGRMSVSVPLANTLFTTGRRHTLLASRWQTHAREPVRLMEKVERTTQTITMSAKDMFFEDSSRSTVASHMVAVTEPRKVLASLGNILSRVEVDGHPASASQELESVIPSLLEQRRKVRDSMQGEDNTAGGPVGVWALIMPKECLEKELATPTPLPLGDYYRPADEASLANSASSRMDKLLQSGCKLHKVLSGGGGWGPKQGLLSLDPQTQLATDDHEDLQSFMDSFQGKGGIASPGTYVQFLVEAAYPGRAQWSIPNARHFDFSDMTAVTSVLGTPGAIVSADPFDAVTSYPSLFGAVSSEGMLLHKAPYPNDERELATKMDMPRSYVISNKRTFTKIGNRGADKEKGGFEGLRRVKS